MKKFSFVLLLAIGFCGNPVNAQVTPSVPKDLPRKPQPTTPTKFKVGQPDLQIVSVSVTSVERQATPNVVRAVLSVTYKNAGNTATTISTGMSLMGSSTDGHGMSTSYVIDSKTVPALGAGESRTVEWIIVKNESLLLKNGTKRRVVIDDDHRIAESDELNNQSPLFTIALP